MDCELKRAAALLSEGEYTCVLCRGERTYTDNRRGVRPLLELLEDGNDLRGFFAADKVVGKAAAFLYVLLGVQAVYARVISSPAKAVLSRYGISLTFEAEVPAIENRTKTGLCPIESSVWNTDDPAEALAIMKHTLENL